jgi:DNA-binding winged helix-turn-helix (wHTH) protein
MGVNLLPPRLLRFGPFELDVRAGQITKHGVRIRLQDQSFQILLMLLEHPGEVVLREEIRQKLWPNNTIVEFDHSINAAIKRLRNALGESADDPRHIETVAKRGYRFLGEVERVGGVPAEPPGMSPPEPVEETGLAEDTDNADADDLSGSVISHYRVLEKIGSGGMGEVYRARDTKLDREVAIKVLPAGLAQNPEGLARFEREAKVLASLNHPNIATIYGIEELRTGRALAMELV